MLDRDSRYDRALADTFGGVTSQGLLPCGCLPTSTGAHRGDDSPPGPCPDFETVFPADGSTRLEDLSWTRRGVNTLLSGIVGSTAYGLAGPGSDVDRLGVFAHDTADLHGLEAPADTVTSSKPDQTFHEARKYAQLALGGNPTVSELMWLPCDLYEVRHPLGDQLIDIRYAFLSAKRVRDAYLGYATQQFKRLEARGDGSFSADTRKRTAKHARHLLRLCAQGLELYRSGTLRIRLEDPQHYLDFGERIAGGDIDHARRVMNGYEEAFDEAKTSLPDEPDRAAVEDWLRLVRVAYFAPNS